MAAASAKPDAPLSKPLVFATSGLGGIFGWIVVHPFNTVAVRMNLANMAGGPPKSLGVFTSEIISKEGVSSLYAGIGAGCLRQVFYATSRLGLFETFRDIAAQYRKTDFAQRFTLASVSGGAAALISCPIEVCLVRMSNDASMAPEKRRGYTSVFDAIARITREEGPAAFYRGSQPFVMRAMVVGGTQVATYDQLKQIYAPLGNGFLNQFCSAMSAGLIYSLITMPLETAKNRMAFQVKDAVTGQLPYTSTLQTLRKISASEGVLSLWHGFLPYYGRCGGHTVTMFVFVDQLRIFYKAYVKK